MRHGALSMQSSSIANRYLELLLSGNRVACREFMSEQLAQTEDPTCLYEKVLWPVLEQLEKLYRADRINIATEHMATRIGRTIADQVVLHLPRREPNGKRLLISCADGEPEELGAQMCADLFEARGWEVYFLGGGVPNDEILSLVGQLRPDILLIFGTQPTGVPGTRRLIDLIREVSAHPTMNTMVSGGVYNRAGGLWKEINADLFARTVMEAIPLAESAEPRAPVVRIAGAPKKRRRRRRPPLLATVEN